MNLQCTESVSGKACERCSRHGDACSYLGASKQPRKPAKESIQVQACNSSDRTATLVDPPEDNQTSAKTSASLGPAPSQMSITSTRKIDRERSVEGSNHLNAADRSAEASLAQALYEYRCSCQSIGQRQMEDTLRRLLDEKFALFQKRRGKSNEEGWLKAIDQLCRAQQSLAEEVGKMRSQLSRLPDLQHRSVPLSHSGASSFDVGTGYYSPELQQPMHTAGSMWNSVDYGGWTETGRLSGNTFSDVQHVAPCYHH